MQHSHGFIKRLRPVYTCMFYPVYITVDQLQHYLHRSNILFYIFLLFYFWDKKCGKDNPTHKTLRSADFQILE